MGGGGQEEGAGDSGAGSGGKKQGPCLYINLPCGLRGAPFLRLSFSFASHRASQSPGWPQICRGNDYRLGTSLATGLSSWCFPGVGGVVKGRENLWYSFLG